MTIINKFCIVTENDTVLEQRLSEAMAEQRLTYYIGHDEDAYIGVTADYQLPEVAPQLDPQGKPIIGVAYWPCREVKTDDGPEVERTDPEFAEYWGVYLVKKVEEWDLPVWQADYPTEAEAQRVALAHGKTYAVPVERLTESEPGDD